jgi:hypothetical protein
MNIAEKAAIKKQVMEAYTSCCMGIGKISNIEAKK